MDDFEYKPIETSKNTNEDQYQDTNLNNQENVLKDTIYNDTLNNDSKFTRNNTHVSDVVIPAEVCTIETARQNKWFSENTSNYFNLRSDLDQNKIKTTSNDFIKNNKNFSICNTTSDLKTAYPNCALTSPWRTFEKNKCKIEKNNCPPNFISQNGSCVLPKQNLQYFQRNKKGFCEEKWYDWFSIPNYHLKNGYQKYIKSGSHNKDITKCFKPCELGTVPFNKDKNDTNNKNHIKCIDKQSANYGLYGKNDYCPTSMVLLLGIDKKYIKDSLLNKVKVPVNKRRTHIYNKQENEVIDKAYNEIIHNAKNYVIKSGIREKDVNKPKLGDIEFDSCVELGENEDLIKAYDICKELSDSDKKKEIINKIRTTYNYSDDRIINKHLNLLYKSCSKCFEIKTSDSYLKPPNNDYSNAILNRLNGEFPDIERKPLSFDNTNKNEEEEDEPERNPLFRINEIMSIFGSYSSTKMEFSYNKLYDLPNLLIMFISGLISFLLLYIIFRILGILYPYFKDIMILFAWLMIEIYIQLYDLLSSTTLIYKKSMKNSLNPIKNSILSKLFS
tara:strand:- start:8707 stop:10380 length:1674 start_codon:yes stop_codon:yes gene_type:complete